MKFLLLSDTHIRATAPEGRIDNFIKVQRKKWKCVIDAYLSYGCEAILQAGDLWNEPNPPYHLLNEYVRLFKENGVKIYTVLGQHDMYMRSSDIKRTANGNLALNGLIEVMQPCPLEYKEKDEAVSVYGVSYDCPEQYEEIDNFFKVSSNSFNILITHDNIGDQPLYPGDKMFDAERFLKDFKEFNLILCGDYHYPYMLEHKGRHIVNTGCLLRMKRTELDMYRKPHFYILDTKANSIEKIYIPIPKISTTFDMTRREKSETKDLDELVAKLRDKGKVGVSYLKNLSAFYKKNQVRESVKKLIADALEN